jgi:hypothetical protein
MATLWGRQWTRGRLLQRVGDIGQIAGARLVELADGKERGSRAALYRTGTGFAFTILIDRSLDIAHAEYCGKALDEGYLSRDVAASGVKTDTTAERSKKKTPGGNAGGLSCPRSHPRTPDGFGRNASPVGSSARCGRSISPPGPLARRSRPRRTKQ